MKAIQPIILAAFALLASTGPGRAEIIIRVSVKFFTDANGSTPAVDVPTLEDDTPQAIAQWLVEGGNDSPDLLQRGYRFVLSENAVILPPGLASWYSRYTREGRAKSDLEAAARGTTPDAIAFKYRPNAVNIYINNFATSGSCSRPANGTITFLGRDVYRSLVAHEAGHFFNLCHTQGCECNGTADADPLNFLCLTQPGNDDLDDTLIDLDTWTRDQVAFMTFGFNYSAPEVTDAQRTQVDYTFQNLMSYHNNDPLPDGTRNPYNLLTQDQLDLYGSTANNQRRAEVSGTSWFVAANGADAPGRGLHSGTPLRTVTGALNAVTSADDVVLLRSATFLAPPGRIITPCTLRATRGPVTLTR